MTPIVDHDDVVRDAEARIRLADLRRGPYRAEIVPGCDARWIAVLTHPGDDLVAAAHLAARGFGVYVADLDYKQSVRGRHAVCKKRMFPGYVFLFVWDIARHRRRIEACPGVAGIFADVSFELIGDILRTELREWLKVHVKTTRRGRRGRQEATWSPKRYFGGEFAGLASDERIGLLRAALSLPSQPLPVQACSGVGS